MKKKLKAKTKERIKQVGLLIFMVLIAVGFTVPAFVNDNDPNVNNIKPRLCQSDSDCYLMCDETPKEIFCTQNMCVINTCEEESYYPYEEDVLSFDLSIKINDELQELSSVNDIFIKFNGNQAKFSSTGLTLKHLFEKEVGAETIILQDDCGRGVHPLFGN